MSKILTTMAAVALMASTAIAPAFAQTSAPAGSAPSPSAPAATQADPAMKPADPSVKSVDSASTMSPAGGTYLTEQGADQVAASDYIGKSIYNAEDKSIGDVNDLIMEQNGGVVAAVVGVGGFLGIGEKNVALPLGKLTITRGDNNEMRLTTTETAESLQAAPKFNTLAEQQSAAQTDATTTSSTTGTMPAGDATAPATPAKP